MRFNCRTRAECCWFKVVEVVDFYILLRREGFEGTDLAALAHLECLALPGASWASQNEEVARQLSFLYLCTFPFNKLMSICLYTKNEPYRTRSSFWLAEREGFEPPEPLSSTVFKTAAIDHSAISPRRNLLARRNSPREFSLPLLLLLTRAHNTPQKSRF